MTATEEQIIIKESGLLWLEGTDIVGKTMAEVSSKVLAVTNLHDLGIDEVTLETYAEEGDSTIIYQWVAENLEPLYAIVEGIDNESRYGKQ